MADGTLFTDFGHDMPDQAEAGSIDKVLDDDQLRAGGLRPVNAYIRTFAPENPNKKYVRQSKKRAEAGENGPPRKQLNIQAPVDAPARDALKQLAAALLSGKVSSQSVMSLVEGNDWQCRASTAEARVQELELELAAAKQRRRWWRLW